MMNNAYVPRHRLQATLASGPGTIACTAFQAPPTGGVTGHVIVSPPENVQPTNADRAPIASSL
jgi:hypothetical protein